MKQQKTVQEYRDIIYILKDRLNDKQNQYQSLKSVYSSVNVFEQTSFDWKVRQKILEEQLNKQERKYFKHKSYDVYGLYYAVRKLMKSCDVLNVTKEMVFRGADKKMEKTIEANLFEVHLQEVLRLPQNSITHIIKRISKQNKVKMNDYYQFLEYFDLLSQKKKESILANDSVDKLIKQLAKQRIKISGLWTSDYINAPQFAIQITKELKDMTVLECISVYYKLNPLHKEELPKRQIVEELQKLREQQIYKQKNTSQQKPNRQKSAKKTLAYN